MRAALQFPHDPSADVRGHGKDVRYLARRSRHTLPPSLPLPRHGRQRRDHIERHARGGAEVCLPDAEYTTAGELAYPPNSKLGVPGRKRYSTTKLCNVLWTYALARHRSGPAQVWPARVTLSSAGSGTWSCLHTHGPFTRHPRPTSTAPPGRVGRALACLAVSPDVEGVTGKSFEGTKENQIQQRQLRQEQAG